MCVAIRFVVYVSVMGLLTAETPDKRANALNVSTEFSVAPIKEPSLAAQCADDCTATAHSTGTSSAPVASDSLNSRAYVNNRHINHLFFNQSIADKLKSGISLETVIDPLTDESVSTAVPFAEAVFVDDITATTVNITLSSVSIESNSQRSSRLKSNESPSAFANANFNKTGRIDNTMAMVSAIPNARIYTDDKRLSTDQSTTLPTTTTTVTTTPISLHVETHKIWQTDNGKASVSLANSNKYAIDTTEIPFSLIAGVTTLAVTSRGETSSQMLPRKLDATNVVDSEFTVGKLLQPLYMNSTETETEPQTNAIQTVLQGNRITSKVVSQFETTQSDESNKVRPTDTAFEHKHTDTPIMQNQHGVSTSRRIVSSVDDVNIHNNDDNNNNNNKVASPEIVSVTRPLPTFPLNEPNDLVSMDYSSLLALSTIIPFHASEKNPITLDSFRMQPSTTTVWPTDATQLRSNDEISSIGETDDYVTVHHINRVTPTSAIELTTVTKPSIACTNKSHKLSNPIRRIQNQPNDEGPVSQTAPIEHNRFNLDLSGRHAVHRNASTLTTHGSLRKLIFIMKTVPAASRKTLVKRHKVEAAAASATTATTDKWNVGAIVSDNVFSELVDVMALPLHSTNGNSSAIEFRTTNASEMFSDDENTELTSTHGQMGATDNGNKTTWPVKHASIVEGDVVLGGLMMVHSRQDTIICGPIMGQGGIQSLEAMLFTLDHINKIGLLPNFTLGAHILDDCDKDTYGLEMAVDFIKGK